MKKSQSLWFENLPQGRDGALRLYCFPYVGGSARKYSADGKGTLRTLVVGWRNR
jgi:surfactin synthase thioesterase subunit